MLLYRAAQEGVFGRLTRFERGSIADALFVYLDGAPEPKSVEALAAGYLSRPWVCLTSAWESLIRQQFPHARVVMRTLMKPARRFSFPVQRPLPGECRLAAMDEEAFNAHPFGYGANYPTYGAFQVEVPGAVVWRDGKVIASASSFLSLDGEVELDVSTAKAYREMGLATACSSFRCRWCLGPSFPL